MAGRALLGAKAAGAEGRACSGVFEAVSGSGSAATFLGCCFPLLDALLLLLLLLADAAAAARSCRPFAPP